MICFTLRLLILKFILITALEDLYGQCEEKFIFIIDEWDSIFRVHRDMN